MEIQIHPASINDLRFIQEIAEKTWPVAYAEILSTEQMRYMLDKMYSLNALEEQLNNGHIFLIAEIDNGAIGFASYELNYDKNRNSKLHKLYVLHQKQGSKAGKALLLKVIENAKEASQENLQLNVNRHNRAVYFYERLGFHIIKEEDIDIGKGYFMNDFVMQLPLR